MIKSLPEEIACISLLAPQADGSLTSDAVSMKNANKAWIRGILAQGANADQCTLTLHRATDVAIGTNAVPANNVPIWYNTDASASDLLTEATAAKSYQFNATQSKNKQVWFEIDPVSYFTSGYDCVYVTSGGSNVANYLAVDIFIEPKSKAAILDTFITD